MTCEKFDFRLLYLAFALTSYWKDTIKPAEQHY